jgi:A/G-specific adenine glycosylase
MDARKTGAGQFGTALLGWYREHKRRLPWRDPLRDDPYAVWVSEIMLQQTRVETVIPYFERWMKRFPTVRALAAASERDVLNLWEGLGYYSRARNLHAAAKIVVERHAGQLPRHLDALRALPGIGPYTAGAIASMAFGLDEPTLDANLRRVMARVFDVSKPADSPAGTRILWGLAAENLPKGRAGDYNQALMDLGASICLPKNPRCLICPLMEICEARRLGIQEQRPVLKPRQQTPSYVHAAAVIQRRGRVLLAKRPSKGLLGGLWEFPNGRVNGDPGKGLAKALKIAYRLRVKQEAALGVVRHAYTHFKVTVHAFHAELIEKPGDKNLKWVRVGELEDYPMGKVDRQIAGLIK